MCQRQQVETRIQKKTPNPEDNVRTLRNISKHTNISIIGMPEGEEEEQEIENYLKQ